MIVLRCNKVLCDDQLVVCMMLHDVYGIYFAVHALCHCVMTCASF